MLNVIKKLTGFSEGGIVGEPTRHSRHFEPLENSQILDLHEQGFPSHVIAYRMSRKHEAIEAQLKKILKLGLKKAEKEC